LQAKIQGLLRPIFHDLSRVFQDKKGPFSRIFRAINLIF